MGVHMFPILIPTPTYFPTHIVLRNVSSQLVDLKKIMEMFNNGSGTRNLRVRCQDLATCGIRIRQGCQRGAQDGQWPTCLLAGCGQTQGAAESRACKGRPGSGRQGDGSWAGG